jgi:hypothetical protein
MNNIIVVEPNSSEIHIDILLTVCGYEKRCIDVASEYKSIAGNHFALIYKDTNVLNYESNLTWYKNNGFELLDIDNEALFQKLLAVVQKIEIDKVEIVVDYSSMCRHLMASMVIVLNRLSDYKTLNVNFIYTPAKYYEPKNIDTEILISQPVIPEFSGKLAPPNQPTIALMGLGYEAERTIGLIEYLEPGGIRAFLPIGSDERFEGQVRKQNDELFGFIGTEDLFEYDVRDPYTLFKKLEGVCYGVLQWGRPVFVPLGPKPFTICSLITSIIFNNEPVVWRVSGGTSNIPIDKERDGEFVYFKTIFYKGA